MSRSAADEDSFLLSPLNSKVKLDSAVMENDKDGKSKAVELDLRLHDAVCDSDDLDQVRDLVQDFPHLLYLKDEGQRSPLHTLVINADEMAPDIAKILLGVSETGNSFRIERPDLLNLQDRAGLTALHYVTINRQVDLMEVFLKWGADPEVQDSKGNTPLHLLAAEGMMNSAIDCGALLLKSNPRKTLINAINFEEKTPMHRAVDTRAVDFVEFLLKPEYGFDMSFKDKSGKNILHYICSATEESDQSCEIIQALVRRSGSAELNQTDTLERTPLHWATIQRLPRTTGVLAAEDNTEVAKRDKEGKTPLHYACQNGCYPNGRKCTEVLLGRKVPETFDQVKYLYETNDNRGHSAFEYACLNCPPETVTTYLGVVPHPQRWLSGSNLTLLYTQSPLALKDLMDRAICEDKKRTSEEEDDILVDYGPITGYSDPIETSSPQQETKYLKQGLKWDYETQKEVLLHPLVQLYIANKWSQLGWIIGLWVLWQIVWLGAFTTLIILFYVGSPRGHLATWIATGIILIYILFSTINEIFEIFKIQLAYIRPNNLAQLARNVFALISIIPILAGQDEPEPWQKYAAATGILLSYILSMRDIGKLHSKIGLVVEVLKQVLIQILQVLLYCSPLWVGFTLAFVVIFEDDETLNTFFPGPLVKVLVMMTGEFEYKDTLGVGGESKSLMASYIVIRFLFFLAFLVSVPVAFFNLLTGFALDKVMELRERAKVGRVVEQLEHIYFIESILLSLRTLFNIFLPHETVVSMFRKLNVTTVWMDQKFGFYTIRRERMQKGIERRRVRKVQGQGQDHLDTGFGWKNLFGICRRRLSREVEDQIFALATSNSSNQTKQ